MKRFTCFLILTASLLFIYSCADPIDKTLIQVAEDTFPPELIEVSPDNNAMYYSTVNVHGYIEDHSLIGGDGEGRIVSINYYLTNNTNRKGKVFIDINGALTADDVLGSGGIDYNRDTGYFSFSFSTVEFEQDGAIHQDVISGFMTIVIELVDANENISEYHINMRENVEPYVNLEEPGSFIVNYEADENIEIYGNVANSSEDVEYNDEIVSLEWMLTMMPNWRQKIDLETLPPGPDGNYEVLSSEDAIGTPLFTYYPNGIVNSGLPGKPEQPGYFYSIFVAPAIEGNLNFRFNVLNKRGTEYSESIDISPRLLSPVFSNISFVTEDKVYFNSSENKYYYSSAVIGADDVWLNGKLSDNGDLTEVKYKIRTNGIWLSERVGYSGPVITTGSEFSFPINESDLAVSPGFYSQIRIEGNNGTGTGYASKYIYDDNMAPLLSVNIVGSDNVNSTAYARIGDSISLNFSVEDLGGDSLAISGINSAPVVQIANHDLILGAGLSDNGGGHYSAVYEMNSIDDSSLNNISIPYSITVSDNVGNQSITSDSSIKYYHGSPVTGTDFSINTNPSIGSYINDGNVVLDFDFDRDVNLSTVNIDLLNATVSQAGDVFTITLDQDNPSQDNSSLTNKYGQQISPVITFADMAGNVYNGDGGVSFHYDWVAPGEPEITGVEGLISGSNGTDYISSNVNSITVNVDLEQDPSTQNGTALRQDDQIILYCNDNPVESYTALSTDNDRSSYSFILTSSNPAHSDVFNGQETKDIYVVVRDEAGNESLPSNTVSPVLDTVLDISDITHNQFTNSGNVISNNQILEINYTAEGHDFAHISITGTTIDDDFSENSYDWDIGSADEGGYSIRIDVSDYAENSDFETLLITIDNDAPMITSILPGIDDRTINDNQIVTISANVSDYLQSGSPTVTILRNGSPTSINQVSMNGTEPSYSYNWNVNNMTAAHGDEFTVTINCIDVLGRTNSESLIFNIDAQGPLAPSVISPSEGDYINGENSNVPVTVDISGTGAEEGDDIVLLLQGNSGFDYSDTISQAHLSAGQVEFNVQLSHLGIDEFKTFRSQITDVLGNPGGISDPVTVTLHTENPSGYSLTYFDFETSPNIEFSLEDILESLNSIDIEYELGSDINGDEIADDILTGKIEDIVTVVDYTSPGIDITALNNGTVSIRVCVIDEAGNRGPWVTISDTVNW